MRSRHLFKKILYTLIAFFAALFIAGYFFAKPIVISLARLKLENAFKDAYVSVKDCGFKPRLISFYDIKVKKDEVYDIKIKEAGIAYDLKDLLRKNISRISLSGVSVGVKPLEIFSADRIDVLNLNPGSAELCISGIGYDNLKTGEIKSHIKFKDNAVLLNPVNIYFLGGNINGDLNILISGSGIVKYELNIKALNLDIRSFVEDFKLTDKFEMTGKLGGILSLAGSGVVINEIKGDFSADKNGGVLIIKDMKFLENIAKSSKQPLDIIVESFKNYNYNSGILKLYMDNRNLVLDVRLSGETGKRNLEIVLHEFAGRGL